MSRNQDAVRELRRIDRYFRQVAKEMADHAANVRDPWCWGVVNGIDRVRTAVRETARKLAKNGAG